MNIPPGFDRIDTSLEDCVNLNSLLLSVQTLITQHGGDLAVVFDAGHNNVESYLLKPQPAPLLPPVQVEADNKNMVYELEVNLDWGLRGTQRRLRFLFRQKMTGRDTDKFLADQGHYGKHYSWSVVKLSQLKKS